MSEPSASTGRFGSPLIELLESTPPDSPLTVLTSYPPSWEHAGGGSFVDRSLLAGLTRVHRHLTVTNRLSVKDVPDRRHEALSSVPLQVRSSRWLLGRVAARVGLRREAYGIAKFRVFGAQWSAAARELELSAPGRLVCTSFVPLLLAHDAGVPIDTYLAFNTEWELSRQHAPRILGRDFERHREIELAMMREVENLYAVSHTDAAALARALGREVIGLDWTYLASAPMPRPGAQSAGRGYRLGVLGSYSWPPNIADMNTLVEVIAPRLRARGIPATSVVAGAKTEVLKGPHVRAMGRVESVREFYDAIDVVVVPRAEATGVSVKVIEARLHGKAVLTSSAVAAALGTERGLVVADTVDEIIRALSGLYDH